MKIIKKSVVKEQVSKNKKGFWKYKDVDVTEEISTNRLYQDARNQFNPHSLNMGMVEELEIRLARLEDLVETLITQNPMMLKMMVEALNKYHNMLGNKIVYEIED